MPELSVEEIRERRKYHKEWRKSHPDNVAAIQLRYWTKKAHQAEQRQREEMPSPDPDAQPEQGND